MICKISHTAHITYSHFCKEHNFNWTSENELELFCPISKKESPKMPKRNIAISDVEIKHLKECKECNCAICNAIINNIVGQIIK